MERNAREWIELPFYLFWLDGGSLGSYGGPEGLRVRGSRMSPLNLDPLGGRAQGYPRGGGEKMWEAGPHQPTCQAVVFLPSNQR